MGILGIIGGSGLYDLPGLEDVRRETIASPFGAPSDAITRGRLGDVDLAFLPRHGPGHRLSPGEVNYRANIDCLKRAGVTDILSLSACGSLKENLAPGYFVLVDQFIDLTRHRPASFFGDGIVAHASMAAPTCARLRSLAADSVAALDIPHRMGGTYVVIEGPQFSTKAESALYRQWGADVIGMTNLPEARLAREAEICYQTIGMVTDYDCWHPDHAHVEVADVIAHLTANAATAKRLIADIAPRWGGTRPEICQAGCDRILDSAIVTPPAARDPAAAARLDAVAGRVLAPQQGD